MMIVTTMIVTTMMMTAMTRKPPWLTARSTSRRWWLRPDIKQTFRLTVAR